MNILTIIIFAILILSICNGYRKGFLKTAFSLIAWVLVLVICNAASPMVKDMLIEQTEIETVVQSVLDAKINEMISNAIEESGMSGLQEGISNGNVFEIPEEIKVVLPEKVNQALLNIDMQNALNGYSAVTAAVADYIVGMIAVFIVLIFSGAAIMVINFILGIASNLPLIGPLDKIMGLACGAVKGVIWSWIILTIVSVIALTGKYTEWAGFIAESGFLTWMQEHNLILYFLTSVR